MLKKLLLPVLAIFSLAVASAVQYTPVFFIDFTKTPEVIQITVAYGFTILASILFAYTGVSIYAEE